MAQRIIDTNWGSTGSAVNPGSVKMNAGWIAEIPAHQTQNFWQLRADDQMQYSQRSGIDEWDALIIFRDNGLTMGSDGLTYQSQQASNLGNQPVGDDGTFWVNVSASVVPYKMNVFTANDAAWVPNALTRTLKVTVTGGGAGAGGADGGGTTFASQGGSGGAGGTAISFFSAPFDPSFAIVVGSGGSGGDNQGTDGVDGVDSSFDGASITIMVGAGGVRGLGDTSATSGDSEVPRRAGGIATGGMLNMQGGDSTTGRIVSGNNTSTTSGGASIWGGGPSNEVDQNGDAGQAYGTGGAGGSTQDSSTGRGGGPGADGVVVVEEFG